MLLLPMTARRLEPLDLVKHNVVIRNGKSNQKFADILPPVVGMSAHRVGHEQARLLKNARTCDLAEDKLSVSDSWERLFRCIGIRLSAFADGERSAAN